LETTKESNAMNQSQTLTPESQLGTQTMNGTAEQAWIRPWLRGEGVAAFAAGLAGFLLLGVPWWAFPLLLVVPDVSMAGYLHSPRVGAIVYNVAHDLLAGVATAGVGLAAGSVPVAAVGAILVAHSGMDRMAGYGLKLPTSFRDTHLGRIGGAS
jgi:hypothetical protein